MKKAFWIAGVATALVAGLAVAGAKANDVEQPDYEVLKTDGDIEIREYPSMIVAQTNIGGDRESARNRGFRVVADYIFGNNISSEEIAMTSPVRQQKSETIAMTSPVTQQSAEDGWMVQFIMPRKYTMDTLPTPANDAVELVEVPARKVAAIRFSGTADKASVDQHERELEQYLQSKGLQPVATPTYAFYDGPWVPGVMRRNEVMIEIAS